jgi:hypothetical protein
MRRWKEVLYIFIYKELLENQRKSFSMKVQKETVHQRRNTHFAKTYLKISIFTNTLKNAFCWALVAHACNPSYSGGRDQKDCGSKPAWANNSQDLISKNPSQK